MFAYIYTFKFYRFIKSGMLCDFFIKKYFYYKLYFIFYIFNIQFTEKYLIEYNFLKLNRYLGWVVLWVDYFTTQFSIYNLTFVFNFTWLLLLVIYLNG